MSVIRNVLGDNLSPCSVDPITGYHRDGYCQCGPEDGGQHIICVQVSDTFLQYSKSKGNDLTTPFPQYGFPGLKDGDRWCLCLSRWIQALEAGVAPPVILASTHENVLQQVPLETLQQYALDAPEAVPS
jgi:uncharacterized protein